MLEGLGRNISIVDLIFHLMRFKPCQVIIAPLPKDERESACD